MKSRTKLLATLGIVAGLAASGYAVTAYAHSSYHEGKGGYEERHGSGMERMHGGKRGHGMMRMMEEYDSNGDGALTLDEITTARSKKFKEFDANGDGVLELGEYQGLWMDAMRERMVDRFQKHDNDGDGKITEEDFSRKFTRMMKWMDRNDDGKVDEDDRPGYHRHGNN